MKGPDRIYCKYTLNLITAKLLTGINSASPALPAFLTPGIIPMPGLLRIFACTRIKCGKAGKNVLSGPF